MDWFETGEYNTDLYFYEAHEKQEEEYRKTYERLGYDPYKEKKKED